MLKCKNCGRIFEKPETSEQFVPYGESQAAYSIGICPYCGIDEFEEAFPCNECGEYFTEDELTNGLCDKCIAYNFDSTDDLFDFAQKITTKGNINEFALSVFSNVDKINSLLKLVLKFIEIENPKMIAEQKAKYIDMHKEDLADEWGKTDLEKFKIL